jgi:WD40 repeat protein
MGKKLLIASGTARYDHLPEDMQRPQLKGVVEDVIRLFTGALGYERVLEEIGADPTSVELVGHLDKWFASADRERSEWVVFYYTGHGDLDGDSLVLLTRDSEDGLAASTGVSAEKLGQILMTRAAAGERRRIKNCLLILDTCHAGAGSFDIIGKLRRFFDEGDPGRFYILAAALPREEAMAGALARAIIESINDESLGGHYQPVLYFDQVEPAVNRRLSPHRALGVALGSSSEQPEFFPNPRYIPGLPAGATVAEIRRAVDLGELQTFWGPTSRGVEMERQPGWYFTGRERVLRELSEWLRDPMDDSTRVITGRAGTGKSAIISRIVTLSDPEYRQSMLELETRWGEAFPPGCVDLAIHAKGKTFQEVLGRVAGSLGVEAKEREVLAALGSRHKPFRIVVDALDEAREPERLTENLLARLDFIPKVKLLVGTRPEYAQRLGRGAVLLSVDAPEYFENNDLADYVASRLLRQGERGAETPYEGKEAAAREVAAAVAEKAGANFLIARLVAEALLAPETRFFWSGGTQGSRFDESWWLLTPAEALDRAAIQARDFPATVAKAFEQFLARFGDDERRVRDLLTPLAWAEGVGLPWDNIWPTLASALSGRQYDDRDVRWVLERAGSFVVEALEQDRSVYRLYHQALADYLRHWGGAEATERLIFTSLAGTVAPLGEGSGKRDWRTAHPYVQVHLAEHAAAGGLLAGLVADPLFLLAVDADRLLSVVEAHPSEIPPEIEHVYKGAFHHLKEKPTGNAASYLEMAARKGGLTMLADRISELPLDRAWSVPWASWAPVSTHRVLASDVGLVTTLAVAQRQGRTVIVSGSGDGSIRIWDLEQGRAAADPMIGQTGAVTALAVAQRQGRTVIVCGGENGSIRIWNLDQNRAVGAPLTGHTGDVRALAVARRQGGALIVSGGGDGSIRIWDLEQGREAHAPLTGHTGPVTALAVPECRGGTVIVSGSADGSIRIWDLEQGREAHAPLTGHTGPVTALAVAECQGGTVMVSGTADGSICIWDLERGRALGVPLTGHHDWVRALAIAHQQGRTLIVSGGYDGSIRVWHLDQRREAHAPLIGHTGDVRALALAQRQGRTVIVSGSYDKSIRIWDLERGRAVGDPPTGRTGGVGTLAVAKRQARSVVVFADAHRGIGIWDLEQGRAVEDPLTGHTGGVTALAVAERRGHDVIVSGSYGGSIRIWDLEQGSAVGSPLTGHTARVTALAVAQREGRTVIVSGSSGSYGGSIRIWDLEQGRAAADPLTWRAAGVTALVVAERQGRAVIVFGVANGSIRIWDLEQGREARDSLTGHDDLVRALAVAERQGRPVIVSGGDDQSIRIWDLEQGREAHAPLTGHTGDVRALAVAQRQGQPVIVSGDKGGSIRIWDLESFSLLRRIDVGAPVWSLAFVQPSTLVVGTSMGLMPIRLHRL